MRISIFWKIVFRFLETPLPFSGKGKSGKRKAMPHIRFRFDGPVVSDSGPDAAA
jgi:hypothetical protein